MLYFPRIPCDLQCSLNVGMRCGHNAILLKHCHRSGQVGPAQIDPQGDWGADLQGQQNRFGIRPQITRKHRIEPVRHIKTDWPGRIGKLSIVRAKDSWRVAKAGEKLGRVLPGAPHQPNHQATPGFTATQSRQTTPAAQGVIDQIADHQTIA